jgi:hypothetical protein
VEQSSGRDRLNIHGAIDLETGETIMKDVLTVDALSTIMLLMANRGECIRAGGWFTSFWTTPDTITQNWFRLGWRDLTAGSSFISSRRIARTLGPLRGPSQSNDYGG